MTRLRSPTQSSNAEFEVFGSSARYTVLINLGTSPVPNYCSCPGFLAGSFSEGFHICKHILASRLTAHESLDRLDYSVAGDFLATAMIRQFTI